LRVRNPTGTRSFSSGSSEVRYATNSNYN